jgi:hypothetical protein
MNQRLRNLIIAMLAEDPIETAIAWSAGAADVKNTPDRADVLAMLCQLLAEEQARTTCPATSNDPPRISGV